MVLMNAYRHTQYAGSAMKWTGVIMIACFLILGIVLAVTLKQAYQFWSTLFFDFCPVNVGVSIYLLWLFGTMQTMTIETVYDESEQDLPIGINVVFGYFPKISLLNCCTNVLRFEDITRVEAGQTALCGDGVGVHYSAGCGNPARTIMNIDTGDCVVIYLNNGQVYKLGTDDQDNLLDYLNTNIEHGLESGLLVGAETEAPEGALGFYPKLGNEDL